MNTLGLIDIGANITHPQLHNQIDKVVENMKVQNINKAIITSSNLKDTRDSVRYNKYISRNILYYSWFSST